MIVLIVIVLTRRISYDCISIKMEILLSTREIVFIPVIFQVASLLAALTHPGHIVIYAPGDSLPCRRDAS
ncbi:hypothetical protein CKY04_14655 [Photorhabdus sp. S8-52]|nr:hypothetical protein CKY05_15005 [Photorhabdus sp. S10-54]RAW96888.1 hypothetical protein CKY03_14370 [Photorhabdus sp. S9-53]RAX01198.1 hypothetical protein CKY04_14655 [Photorhabdus sp. S8-52]